MYVHVILCTVHYISIGYTLHIHCGACSLVVAYCLVSRADVCMLNSRMLLISQLFQTVQLKHDLS